MSHGRIPAAALLLASCLVPAAAPVGVSAQATGDVSERAPGVTLPAELGRVLRDYERAWAEGDAAGLAGLFVPEGFVRGRTGWIRGREAIRRRYAGAGGPLRLRALGYAVDGDVGWIVGAYGYGTAAREVDTGSFVLALRRGGDGRWLIAADLDATHVGGPPGG